MVPPVGIVVKMILMFILHYNSLGHEMIMKMIVNMIVKIMKVTWPELVLRKNLRSNFAFASLVQYDTVSKRMIIIITMLITMMMITMIMMLMTMMMITMNMWMMIMMMITMIMRMRIFNHHHHFEGKL